MIHSGRVAQSPVRESCVRRAMAHRVTPRCWICTDNNEPCARQNTATQPAGTGSTPAHYSVDLRVAGPLRSGGRGKQLVAAAALHAHYLVSG
eukprot:686344-Rhodomonas_salina.4